MQKKKKKDIYINNYNNYNYDCNKQKPRTIYRKLRQVLCSVECSLLNSGSVWPWGTPSSDLHCVISWSNTFTFVSTILVLFFGCSLNCVQKNALLILRCLKKKVYWTIPSPFFSHVDNDKIKFTSAVKEKQKQKNISMNLVHSGTYMNFPWLEQWWHCNICLINSGI